MSRSRARRKPSPAPPKSRARPTAHWPALLVVVLGIATYWNGLSGPFLWDDQTAIVDNTSIRQLWPVSIPLSPPRDTPVAGRPLVNLSFAVNYAFGGLNEYGYHAVNLAIHIACALLLFAIVGRTLPRKGAGGVFLALIVASIWLVHPLLSEVVDYATQRSESMMGLFLLLTVYAAIRARGEVGQPAKKRGTPADERRWLILSIAACACGMLTKESMVVAPLIVVLYDRAFEFDSFREAVRARLPLYIGLSATWAIAAAIIWSAPRSTVGVSATVGSWSYLLNQAGILIRYLRTAVWPSGLVLDYGLPRLVAIRDALPSGIVMAALIVGALVAFVRRPAMGFLPISVFVLLAPTSSVIPVVTEVGAARRMYLPLAALIAMAVVGVWGLIERRRASGHTLAGNAAATLAVLLIAALAATTVARNAEYQDPLVLWRADVERRPHGRSRMALATELATAGRHAEAIEQLRLAVTDFPNARSALGTELLLQQQFDEGISILQEFIAERPSLPNRIPAHVLLAQAYGAQGQLDRAEAEWRTVLAMSPADSAAKSSLAQVLVVKAQSALQRQDAARAETSARDAIRLAPGNSVALNLLGVALASQGRMEEARSSFREALQIAPDDSQTRNNLERAERELAAARSRSNP